MRAGRGGRESSVLEIHGEQTRTHTHTHAHAHTHTHTHTHTRTHAHTHAHTHTHTAEGPAIERKVWETDSGRERRCASRFVYRETVLVCVVLQRVAVCCSVLQCTRWPKKCVSRRSVCVSQCVSLNVCHTNTPCERVLRHTL